MILTGVVVVMGEQRDGHLLSTSLFFDCFPGRIKETTDGDERIMINAVFFI
jgi:hypothetical protein